MGSNKCTSKVTWWHCCIWWKVSHLLICKTSIISIFCDNNVWKSETQFGRDSLLTQQQLKSCKVSPSLQHCLFHKDREMDFVVSLSALVQQSHWKATQGKYSFSIWMDIGKLAWLKNCWISCYQFIFAMSTHRYTHDYHCSTLMWKKNMILRHVLEI